MPAESQLLDQEGEPECRQSLFSSVTLIVVTATSPVESCVVAVRMGDPLVKGTHLGGIEQRRKCYGECEFDGQLNPSFAVGPF